MKLGQRCFYRCDKCWGTEEGFDHELPDGWSSVNTRGWSPDSDSNTHVCGECSRREEEEREKEREKKRFSF